MNFITEYTRLSTAKGQSSFIGMNTGKGFVGSYDKIINEKALMRLYVIKGAPGTGKSTIMRRLAEIAEDKGREVCYYLCGSDHNSLDAVIIDGMIAVVDGTLPHSLEMCYPGASSELLDTTRFWKTEELIKNRDAILYLTDAKRRSFTSAYSLLEGVSCLNKAISQTISYAVESEKTECFCDRLVHSLGKPKGSGQKEEIILRSVGMNGAFRLDTLEKLCKKTVTVSDFYSSAYVLMNILCDKISKAGFDILISRDPVTPSNICDIYVPISGLLITVEAIDESDKNINMSRFVDNTRLSEIRGTLRRSLKCSASLRNEALRLFGEGGRFHFELEKIYSSAMDFESANILMKSFDEICTMWQ